MEEGNTIIKRLLIRQPNSRNETTFHLLFPTSAMTRDAKLYYPTPNLILIIRTRNHDFNYFLQFDRTTVLPAVLPFTLASRNVCHLIIYFITRQWKSSADLEGCLYRFDSNILSASVSEIINHDVEEAKLESLARSSWRISMKKSVLRWKYKVDYYSLTGLD